MHIYTYYSSRFNIEYQIGILFLGEDYFSPSQHHLVVYGICVGLGLVGLSPAVHLKISIALLHIPLMFRQSYWLAFLSVAFDIPGKHNFWFLQSYNL